VENTESKYLLEQAIEEGHAMNDIIKVGRRGVSEELVRHIWNKWNTSSVVKLHCSGKHANDMKKLANELEIQTKGKVIFRSGGTVIIQK